MIGACLEGSPPLTDLAQNENAFAIVNATAILISFMDGFLVRVRRVARQKTATLG
jgi:hypothetical protein